MKIAVVGGYGVGMTMTIPRFPSPGETVLGGTYRPGPGGKGSNQALAAARLGAHVELLTAIGGDRAGDDGLALWTDAGIGTDAVVRAESATMVGFILVDAAGENEITIAAGALDELTAAHVEPFRSAIRAADVAVVSLEIPLDAACAAMRIAHEEGTLCVLNPAPAAELPEDAWRWIDVMTPNRGEAAQLLGLDEHSAPAAGELLTRLREKTSAAIVMTLGADGAAVCDGSERYAVAPFAPHRVADTTGAGDTFTAALAVALAEGQPLADAARFAAAAGCHAVTVHGVLQALPSRDAVDRILAA